MYQMFRNQFLSFSMYQSKLLRALGEGLGPAVAAHSSRLSRVVPWPLSCPGTGMVCVCGAAADPIALSPQALCSSSSTTTRAGACTGCGRWARGTTWT